MVFTQLKQETTQLHPMVGTTSTTMRFILSIEAEAVITLTTQIVVTEREGFKMIKPNSRYCVV